MKDINIVKGRGIYMEIDSLSNLKTSFILDKLWQFSSSFLHIVLIFIACKLAVKFSNKFIDKILNRENITFGLFSKRGKTLSSIIQSVIRYVIYFSAIVMVLAEMDIDLKPILASAGIIGLAISFGAQSLVKDVITGFFILFEDQYAVSEYVTTAGVSGYVEELGLRVTKLRDFKGELHIIPNGLVKQVTNHTRGSNQALVDIEISINEDIDRILNVLNIFCQNYQDNKNLLEGPEVLGIVAMTSEMVLIRIMAKTKPLQQWVVERNIRKELKKIIDKNNIMLAANKQDKLYYSKGFMHQTGHGG